jgi:hypothetical protein
LKTPLASHQKSRLPTTGKVRPTFSGSLRDDPERRLLAIGQMQGFLAALSETVPAETFNHYLEQMRTLDAPCDDAEGFLNHFEPRALS